MGALTAIRLCLELDPATTQLILVAPAVMASGPRAREARSDSGAAPGVASSLRRGCAAAAAVGRGVRRWLVAGLLRVFGASLILPLHMLAYSADFWRKGKLFLFTIYNPTISWERSMARASFASGRV